MRKSLSGSKTDDTFEAVLRAEFELMRSRFERQVAELKDENIKEKVAAGKIQVEAAIEIERLKVMN